MIAALIAVIALLFVWSVLATAKWWVAEQNIGFNRVSHERELAGVNKVGKWYENRVEELENENRQLAEQVVISGSVPRLAMPLPGPDEAAIYAYDGTGLIREKLDPRDVPYGPQ